MSRTGPQRLPVISVTQNYVGRGTYKEPDTIAHVGVMRNGVWFERPVLTRLFDGCPFEQVEGVVAKYLADGNEQLLSQIERDGEQA